MRRHQLRAISGSVALLAGTAVGVALLASPASAVSVKGGANATGSPSTVSAGTSVSVSGTGFAAGSTVFILECSGTSGQSACNTSHGVSATASSSGAVTARFTVFTGAVGSGSCNPGARNCFLVVSDLGQTHTAAIGLTFAGGATTAAPPTRATTAASAPTTSKSGTTAGAGSTGTGTAPTSVSAGSGGTADRHGPDVVLLVGVGLGGVVLVGATAAAARRRRHEPR